MINSLFKKCRAKCNFCLTTFYQSFKPFKFDKNVKVLFYPMLHDVRRSTAFWKVPRLHPFVFLTRLTGRWRCLWSNGGIILRWEDWSYWEEGGDIFHCHCPLQVSYGLACDRTWVSAVERPAFWSFQCVWIVIKNSVPTTQETALHGRTSSDKRNNMSAW